MTTKFELYYSLGEFECKNSIYNHSEKFNKTFSNGSIHVALSLKHIKTKKLKTFGEGLNNKSHIQILKFVKN
jgi:hypothetical protein